MFMQTISFERFKIAAFLKGFSIGWIFLIALYLGKAGGIDDDEPICPNDQQCNQLNGTCLNCNWPSYCEYGSLITINCKPILKIDCQGEKSFQKQTRCLFCYQTDPRLHICDPVFGCSASKPPPNNLVPTTCTVEADVICMGQRKFHKRIPCQWTNGRYKWSTALILSITLGGFGVDRFYLGLWKSGLGKLFSFGGLGVWTIIDVILIATGYVGPADNSLYMY